MVFEQSKKNLVVNRLFDAPPERVWQAWTDPEQVKRWWGPRGFTAPFANIDFREGGTSLVCMRSPDGRDLYNTWTYTKIIPLQEIEFVQNPADRNGRRVNPVEAGMPPDFPQDMRTTVTFKLVGDDRTQMTVTEYDYASERLLELSKAGLEQVLDKMGESLSPGQGAPQGSYALVNGINLYYETSGQALPGTTPLIALHGGLGTTGMFAGMLPELTQGRQVIAVDLRGHGHTEDGDSPLSFEGMADDIAALIEHLGLEKADLLGYSLGGGAALQATIRRPDLVRKLVLVSTPVKRQGWYPEVLQGMAAMTAEAAKAMVGSPMQAAYAAAAPQPESWPMLVDKVGRLLEREYDWSEAAAAIRAPVLLVYGDADAVSPRRAAEFFELLGGGQRDAGWDGSGMSRSRLAILPATIHYAILQSPLLAPIVTAFLEAPLPNQE